MGFKSMTVFAIFALGLTKTAMAQSDYNQLAEETYRSKSNTITVQIIRSSYPMDWSSSRNILFSVMKNRFWFPKTRSTLGHLTIEVNCSLGGNQIRMFAGQGVANLLDFQEKITGGYGFSILNSPDNYPDLPQVTVEGKINTYEEMLPQFNLQLERDNLSFISFHVGEKSCLDAYLFVREYKRKTENTPLAGNIYGFGADPGKFEGSGCAPFVQTVLRKAGLNSVAEAMEQNVVVPKRLIGNPERDEKVTIFDLVWHDLPLDGSYEGPKLKFSFPDPEKLYEYLKANYDSQNVMEKQVLDGVNSYYLMLNFERLESPEVDSDPSV